MDSVALADLTATSILFITDVSATKTLFKPPLAACPTALTSNDTKMENVLTNASKLMKYSNSEDVSAIKITKESTESVLLLASPTNIEMRMVCADAIPAITKETTPSANSSTALLALPLIKSGKTVSQLVNPTNATSTALVSAELDSTGITPTETVFLIALPAKSVSTVSANVLLDISELPWESAALSNQAPANAHLDPFTCSVNADPQLFARLTSIGAVADVPA